MNIGSLTRKAKNTKTIKRFKVHKDSEEVSITRIVDLSSILEDLDSAKLQMIKRRRGSEAATV